MSLLFTTENCGYPLEVRYLNSIIERVTYNSSIINPDSDGTNETNETNNINTIMDKIVKILNKRENLVGPDELKKEVKKYILENSNLPKFDELRKDLVKELQTDQENSEEKGDPRRKDVNIDKLYGLGTDEISKTIGKNIDTIYETITGHWNIASKESNTYLIKELIVSIILQDGFEKKRETIEELLNQAKKSTEIAEVIGG